MIHADKLVDSIGVVTHLHYNPTPYAKSFDTIIVPRLKELGLRHLREGMYTWPGFENDFAVKRMAQLARTGCKFNLIVSRKTPWAPETRFSELRKLYDLLGGAVSAFEGINEPDIQGDMPDWIPTTKRLQQTLWQTVKADPVLKSVPVLGPSLVKNDSAAKLGDLSAWCNYGNLHTYAGSSRPSGPIDSDLRWKGPTTPGALFAVTECGYHNAVNTTSGHRPQTEQAAGVYAPVLFLENVRRGFVRSFWYEFIDEYVDVGKTDPEKNFGLLRNDGSLKPAAQAVKRLIALNADPGETFTPAPYPVTAAGAHVVTTGKRDGTRLIHVWREVDYGALPAEVVVTLPRPEAAYKLHRFAEGDTLEVTLGQREAAWEITNRIVMREGKPELAGGELREVSGQNTTKELVLELACGLNVIELKS